jgi:CubicO group peptidase (beta-lactamase class C family)
VKLNLHYRTVATMAGVMAMLAVAACSREANITSPPSAPVPANIDELKSAIAAILKKYNVPGVGIALVTKDQVLWTGGVGKADIATNRDVTGDTMFRVGSITKGFVALSALQLAEHGKLSLDAKVADVASEIPVVNPWEATNPVTLAQLLEHTAGFNDFSLAEFYDFDSSPDSPRPLLWVLTHFRGPEHVRWQPGTRMSYSNPGYGLAGYIIEKFAGMPLEDYIAQNILRPLGMTRSDMRLTRAVKNTLAQGYDDGSPVPYFPIYLRPAAELKSSPNEMARFVRMMLNRGKLDGVKIVSPESITRMETPQTSLAARAGLKDGYGLGNYEDEEEPLTQHGHEGVLDGFLSRYVYVPEAGVGYFFSINNFSMRAGDRGPMHELEHLLYTYLTRGVKAHQEPAVQMPPGASAWTGYYEPAAPRQQKIQYLDLLLGGRFVSLRDGRLYVRSIFGTPSALIPVGGNQFRSDESEEATAIFTTDAKGKTVMVVSIAPAIPLPGYFVKTSALWPMTRLALVLGALVAMLSSVGFAIIWIPQGIFVGRVEHLAIRMLPLLATISILAAFAMALTSEPIYLARIGLASLTNFIGTIAFAIFSFIGLVLTLSSSRSAIHRGVHIHSFLVAMACVGLTSYLAYWGQLGLRFWQPW